MEAVPRLPMINFDLKTSPENPDFNLKIKRLIAELGEDPSGFDKEIKELETLRANTCIRPAETVDGVAVAKRYYCQILFLKNRFKLGSDSPFQFAWKDIFSNDKYSVTDVNHELASVLYNIGALHSKLGGGEARQDSDSMKMAVAHFQCAAWAFHALPDKYPQDADSDLASEVLAFESGLCLAQAQECILEKSLLDNRKPAIIAKVCGQVVEYYKQALKQLDISSANSLQDHSDSFIDLLGSKLTRTWRALIDFKISYYICISNLHLGMASEESGRWGERVTYYQAASEALNMAVRSNKEDRLDQTYKGVTDTLVYTNDVVNGKLEISKKENEFIYHEKVPEIESLPGIKGASLVKGIPFDPTDTEVSGGDLFGRIVTLETHAASSMYSEELAKMLRTVGGEIETANDSLVLYLSSLQLEDIPNTDNATEVPQEIIDCCAGLSVRPQCVSQLQQAMAKLASVSADVEASLQEIQVMLKEEEQKEGEFSAIVGPRPKQIMSDLERETGKYHAAHSMASESNLTLHTAMKLHVNNLKLLSQPIEALKSSIPSLAQLDEKTLLSLEDMRNIMKKVDEMRNQRRQLEHELRTAVQNDDITDRIAVKGNNDSEKMFEEEVKKHDKVISYIRQNISAQSPIVQAMSERNAEYADARDTVDNILRQREETLGQLVASYHAYEDLLHKTTKGLEFYDKLDGNVSKLLDRVKGVVKVQEDERRQLMESTEQKAAEARAMSLRLISGDTKPNNYSPAAPPSETPEHELPPTHNSFKVASYPTGDTTSSRPKLSDYLAGGYKPGSPAVPAVQAPPQQQQHQPTPQIPSQPTAAVEMNRRPKLSDYLKAKDPPATNLGTPPPPVVSGDSDPPATSTCSPAAVQQHQTGIMQQQQQQFAGYQQYYQNQMAYLNNPAYLQQQQQQQKVHQNTSQSMNPQQQLPNNQEKAEPQSSNQQIQPQAPSYPPQQQHQWQQFYQQPIINQPRPHMNQQPNQQQFSPQVTQQQQQQHDVGKAPLSNVSAYQQQQLTVSQPGQITQLQQRPTSVPQPSTSASADLSNVSPYQQQRQTMTQPSQISQPQQQVNIHCPASMPRQVQPPTSAYQQQQQHSQYQPYQQHQQMTMHHPPSLSQPQQYNGQQQPTAVSSQNITAHPQQQTLSQQQQPSNHTQAFQYQLSNVNQGQQQPSVSQQQRTLSYQQPASQQQQPQQPTYQQQQPQHQPSIIANKEQIPANYTSVQFPISHQQHQQYYQYQQNLTPYQQLQAAIQQPSPNSSVYHQASYQNPNIHHQMQQPQNQTVTTASTTLAATTTTEVKPQSSNVSMLSELNLPVSQGSIPVIPAVPMPGTVRQELPQQPPDVGNNSITDVVIDESVDKIEELSLSNITIPAMTSENIEVTEQVLNQNLLEAEATLLEMTNKFLEDQWKDILMNVDSLQKKKESVSVARCYPFKNRAADVLPFDYNRVVLRDTKDDYINASVVQMKDVKDNSYIITQMPNAKEKSEFWSLLWQEGIETVVCLVSDAEMGQSSYLPSVKNEPMLEGNFTVTVQSITIEECLVTRVVNLHNKTVKQTRALIHIQVYPVVQPRTLANVADTMRKLRQQQRVPSKHVLVHCVDGGKASGTLVALSALISDLGSENKLLTRSKSKLADLVTQRKGIFRDKTCVKVVYDSLIEYLKLKLGKDITTLIVEKKDNDINTEVDFSVASLKAELLPKIAPAPSENYDLIGSNISLHDTLTEPAKQVPRMNLDDSLDGFVSNSNIPTDLTNLADLSIKEDKKKKFTKDDFSSPSKIGAKTDSADPLSQLDPLWSLK